MANELTLNGKLYVLKRAKKEEKVSITQKLKYPNVLDGS
jgi:hypothetical protein